ncbi:hypothetical protein A2Z33_02610 [Candidatus Gottesmanbacteria bacterium RBG_16_52_11]|uniref:histidine kinase n=1 Tax=Candidatus Gottesmanbacteria bacterium RBG_16_52_11 TaxID=1798374 RepID=A0A1F5YN61_9BACT|nr:MAG: hypothetical protein A2Z33_02610 [Candidatus Gottesmanbacteria bacterium RBG_16_52_11]
MSAPIQPQHNINDSHRPSFITESDEIADMIPYIVAEVDKNKIYTWMNQAGRDFFGEAAVGKEAEEFFVGEQSVYEKVEPLFKGSSDVYYVESWQRRQDGQTRLLAWWCHALKNNTGEIVGALSCARDITDSRKVEEKLKENEAQLSNALRIGHLGPWEYDFERDIFTFNDLFYAMFRTTVDKVGSYTLKSAEYASRFLYPEDVALVGTEIQKAIDTKDPNFFASLEHRIRYADGETGYITVRFFIVKNDQGKTIRSYGVNQDITDRKKSEEDLKNAKTDLEQKVKELEKINNLMVNRELKMVELKAKITELDAMLSERSTVNK